MTASHRVVASVNPLGYTLVAVLLASMSWSAVAGQPPARSVPGWPSGAFLQGSTPRIQVERSDGVDGPPRLRFRDVSETGRSQTLQRWIPPGPWRNAGLVPSPDSGVDAVLPVPLEDVVLYRLLESTNRTVVQQWFTGSADTRSAVIPAPPFGEPWFVRGIGWTHWTQARIGNGMLVDENPHQQVTYLCQRLPGRPSRMEGTVEWRRFFVDGDKEAVFVMAMCREGGEEAWYLNCVHVRLHRGAVSVDVIQDGRIIQGLFSGGIIPSLEAGRRHHFAVELDGELVRVHVDGRTVLEGSDPRIERLAGPAVFWEIYSDPGRRRLSGAIHGVSAEIPPTGSRLSVGPGRR